MRYSSASKLFENVKLLKSHGVYGNCSGEACSSGPNMCQHGGQCVDLVTRTECDCEGTGYYGRYCEKSGIGAYFPLRIPSCAQKGVLFQRHFSRAMHTKRLSAVVCPCELSLSDRTFRNLSISVRAHSPNFKPVMFPAPSLPRPQAPSLFFGSARGVVGRIDVDFLGVSFP